MDWQLAVRLGAGAKLAETDLGLQGMGWRLVNKVVGLRRGGNVEA